MENESQAFGSSEDRADYVESVNIRTTIAVESMMRGLQEALDLVEQGEPPVGSFKTLFDYTMTRVYDAVDEEAVCFAPEEGVKLMQESKALAKAMMLQKETLEVLGSELEFNEMYVRLSEDLPNILLMMTQEGSAQIH